MIKKLCLFIMIQIVTLGLAQALPDPSQDIRVKKVYDHFKDELIWVKNGEWSPCGKTLLETLSHVEEDGLWQEDYAPFVKTLQKADLSTPEAQKRADQLMTLAALNYIYDMKGERLNPHLVNHDIYVKPTPVDPAVILSDYLSLPDQCGWIHALAPASPDYHHLKQVLALYRQKQSQGSWPKLPDGTKLQKGDQGPLIETLRAQLIAQDALPSEGQSSDNFDDKLEDAVKAYQTLHGLEPDGKVGGATLKALNTPIDDRIRSLIVTLERYRWYQNPPPARYLQVNIPGFYLKGVEGGKTLISMPIITGKEYRKTPVFNAPMTEVIFNPAWHVPASIVPELLPKIESNPEAYARKGYHIEGDKIIQAPGNANSLGKIRFTIQSPFSVYLHGTPNHNLFHKAKRSLSHGCIRVENPYRLAEFVFHDPQTWALEKIKEEASGTRTKPVKLEKPLPVFVTYFTVFNDENHKIHFVDDEYAQDKAIWQALVRAKRY